MATLVTHSRGRLALNIVLLEGLCFDVTSVAIASVKQERAVSLHYVPTSPPRRWQRSRGEVLFFHQSQSEIPPTLGALQYWAAGSFPSSCPGILPPLHKAITVAENEGPVTIWHHPLPGIRVGEGTFFLPDNRF